jgi:hypothetical protein
MSYDEIPRPHVEHHYHIRELIEAQEKRTADRNYHRERIKDGEERQKVLSDSKLVCVTDFWCNRCQKDFKALTIREIQNDWNTEELIAFYRTKCRTCENWTTRLITDKHKDGFWSQSRNIALDRGRNYNDMIQPHMTGFNLLYNHKRK